MAATFKNVICALGLFSLFFLGIPIRVDKTDLMEQEFQQFIEKQNGNVQTDWREQMLKPEVRRQSTTATTVGQRKDAGPRDRRATVTTTRTLNERRR